MGLDDGFKFHREAIKESQRFRAGPIFRNGRKKLIKNNGLQVTEA